MRSRHGHTTGLGIPADCHSVRPHVHDLSTIDGGGERIIIPTELRPACLNALHAAHQGISGMTARAESSLFWLGITRDIADTRNRCAICNGNAPRTIAAKDPYRRAG